MRPRKHAVFLAPLLCLPSTLACSDVGRAASGVTVRDSAGVEIVTSSLPTVHGELIEQLRIGVQEGDENLQFFMIQSVGVDGSA